VGTAVFIPRLREPGNKEILFSPCRRTLFDKKRLKSLRKFGGMAEYYSVQDNIGA